MSIERTSELGEGAINLNGNTYEIVETSSRATEAPGENALPVYRLQPSGTPAIPSGLVFVRLRDGVPIESRRDQLAPLGYTLVRPSPVAPHAGWVRASTGRLAETLANAGRLKTLPEVEGIELQMVLRRATR